VYGGILLEMRFIAKEPSLFLRLMAKRTRSYVTFSLQFVSYSFRACSASVPLDSLLVSCLSVVEAHLAGELFLPAISESWLGHLKGEPYLLTNAFVGKPVNKGEGRRSLMQNFFMLFLIANQL